MTRTVGPKRITRDMLAIDHCFDGRLAELSPLDELMPSRTTVLLRPSRSVGRVPDEFSRSRRTVRPNPPRLAVALDRDGRALSTTAEAARLLQ